MIEKWIEDAATELVAVMRYARRYQTHYRDEDEIEGFAAIIAKHYKTSRDLDELDSSLRELLERVKRLERWTRLF